MHLGQGCYHNTNVRSLLVVLTFAAVGVAPLASQRLAPAYPRWEPDLRWASGLPSSSATHTSRLFPQAPDHRWEGLVVGGLLVGALGAALGDAFCGQDETLNKPSCVGPIIEGFAVGAVVGGVTGGLLGGLIPKTPPDSTERP